MKKLMEWCGFCWKYRGIVPWTTVHVQSAVHITAAEYAECVKWVRDTNLEELAKECLSKGVTK